MKGVTKEWALSMGFSVLIFLALGFGLTWVNIERVDMAYELKKLQTEADSQDALISKLEVERNTLITPERLRTLAAQYGLTQAKPGQIRRLSAGGDELPSPVIKAAPIPEKPQKKALAASDAKGQGKPDKARSKHEGKIKAEAAKNDGGSPKAKADGAKGAGARDKKQLAKNPKRTPVPYDAAPGGAPDPGAEGGSVTMKASKS